MVFYHKKLRLELSTIDTNVKMEMTSEDGINHVHIIPLSDYLDLLHKLSDFNKEFINSTEKTLN